MSVFYLWNINLGFDFVIRDFILKCDVILHKFTSIYMRHITMAYVTVWLYVIASH